MASYGTIIARVFTSQAELPISGAYVAFSQRERDGAQRIIAIQVTDSSGKTAPVALITPSLYESTSPGYTTPYALCDISVQYPGYYSFFAENVQIFPGVQTVQKVELIPLPHQLLPKRSGSVVMPPQDL